VLLCSYLGRKAFAVLVLVFSLSVCICCSQSVSQGFWFSFPLSRVFEYRNSYRDLVLREGEREAELWVRRQERLQVEEGGGRLKDPSRYPVRRRRVCSSLWEGLLAFSRPGSTRSVWELVHLSILLLFSSTWLLRWAALRICSRVCLLFSKIEACRFASWDPLNEVIPTTFSPSAYVFPDTPGTFFWWSQGR
jgi:hypothetical protein